METLTLKKISIHKGSKSVCKCKRFTYKGLKYKYIILDDYYLHTDVYVGNCFIGVIHKNKAEILKDKTSIVNLC